MSPIITATVVAELVPAFVPVVVLLVPVDWLVEDELVDLLVVDVSFVVVLLVVVTVEGFVVVRVVVLLVVVTVEGFVVVDELLVD
jgi:hypothetical protein